MNTETPARIRAGEPKREAKRRARDAAEPPEKACQTCGVVKPAEEFRQVPAGGRAHNCHDCLRSRQKKEDRRLAEPDKVILEELWEQYDQSEKQTDRIRCLEALVKLRGGRDAADANSKLGDPAIVAQLVKAMKAKRKESQTDVGT